jgi:dolichol-phosphate mannosyltransferase
LFYRFFNMLSEVPIHPNAADFRLLDRQAIDALKSMKERRRFLRGMIGWLGLPEATVSFMAAPRVAGTSKYGWGKQWTLGMDALISFSTKPLRMSLWLGVMALGCNVLYAGYVLYMYFWKAATLRGWSSMILLIMFLGSIQLIILGLIGEYLGSIFEEIKGRPLFLIGSVIPKKSAVTPIP